MREGTISLDWKGPAAGAYVAQFGMYAATEWRPWAAVMRQPAQMLALRHLRSRKGGGRTPPLGGPGFTPATTRGFSCCHLLLS